MIFSFVNKSLKFYLLHPWEWFYDVYSNARMIWQRGTTGFASCDLWAIDAYLATIIPSMLECQKYSQHGHICYNGDSKLWELDQSPNGCKNCNKIYDEAIEAWDMLYNQQDFQTDLFLSLPVKKPKDCIEVTFGDKLNKNVYELATEHQNKHGTLTKAQVQKKEKQYEEKMMKGLHNFIDNIQKFWD